MTPEPAIPSDTPNADPAQAIPPSDPVAIAIRFLETLFEPTDLVLFRPVETWDENGRKQSQVDFRNTCWRAANRELLEITVGQLINSAEQQPLNLFFGVCPRFGPQGRFDLAWQIRTVRTLWTDIDHVTVEDARARVIKAGLPPPSITVNSGNGVHLYWLFDQPYLIDDAGDPPPVETEWLQQPNGRKKPRKYILEHDERVYLDQRRHVARLSPRAETLQDILAGIAQALGGDHTTDLSRLLRIPGSFNRKNERNGRTPVPTELVDCDPSRKYPLAVFERLKSTSPDTQRAKQIAEMPLPQVRKLSASKADSLAELIAACRIAPAGRRSEADFAVCCYALRHGIAQDEVWAQVAEIGKFAEQGERYFKLTWANAEFQIRTEVHDKLQVQVSPESRSTSSTDSGGEDALDGPDVDDNAPGRPVIAVDATIMPVSQTLSQVTDLLLSAGNCFTRTEQLVVIHNQQIAAILSTAEMAGLLNQHGEFFFIDDGQGSYKPFPPSYGNTWLNNPLEHQRLPQIRLFSRNPVYTDDWRIVAPGYDPGSGIYYAGPEVTPRDGTEYLDTWLRDFCFQSPADRTNYLGMLLTMLLIPRFIGSKPAVLFNGNQPNLGKSILAQNISILRDGQTAETASYNSNDEEFEKRLGAIVRSGTTTIIIDNAKSQGRNPRIESACLERSITDPILSYRLLGQSASIRAENSHIFCITANTPDVSRDLVTRCLVVNLFHEGNPDRRQFSIADPEAYAQEHRCELLGELLGMVERWKSWGSPRAETHSRFNKRGWGNIVGGILEACGEPDFLANAEDAATQLDDTPREFAELVERLSEHPQGIWTPAEIVGYCEQHNVLSAELGAGSARSRATRFGVIAGRYVAERFELADGRTAVWQRSEDRKGKVYRVGVIENVPNVG